MPTCARCARLNHECSYPVRNPAVAYLQYANRLEAEIAILEQELRRLDQDGAASGHIMDPRTQPMPTPVTTSPTPSDSLIQHLFANSVPGTDPQIKGIVDDFVQVSLSALTLSSAAHDQLLQTIILSAALPADTSRHRSAIRPLGLPEVSVAEKVLLRYCDDVLPKLPFLCPADLGSHLRRAYRERSPYSGFIVSTVLATTAVTISPNSVSNAAALLHGGLRRLEESFGSRPEDNYLQDLEAVIALAQFAAVAGDAHSDAWALTGIATRIAVDLGLHKICDSDRKRKLFWSAYTLDRQVAAARGLPAGIPDGAIEAEFPEGPHPFTHPHAS